MPQMLSPSSLQQFESCPNTFYLTRILGYPKEPQGPAAAVGSAVDALLKVRMIADTVAGHGTLKDSEREYRKRFLTQGFLRKAEKILYADAPLEKLLFETNVEPEHREEARAAADRVLKFYCYREASKAAGYRFHDIEYRRIWPLKLKIKGKSYVVPLYGILDCIVAVPAGVSTVTVTFRGVPHALCPWDLKTSGYVSGGSVKARYTRCIDLIDKSEVKGPHPKMEEGLADFSTIDAKWATQGCTYGWIQGITPFTPFMFYIDNIVFTGKSIKLAQYAGLITPEFQKAVAMRYLQAWSTIRGGKLTSGEYDKVGCSPMWAEIMAADERWWL